MLRRCISLKNNVIRIIPFAQQLLIQELIRLHFCDTLFVPVSGREILETPEEIKIEMYSFMFVRF
jgi:hypothetical protein